MKHASEKRVMVVDDEPDVRNFLAACLEDAGFKVETAVDGLDALEKVETFIPDLMTLDMVMPRMSGVKVLRTLRKNKKWANLPIIVITAHARDEMGSDQIEDFMAMTSKVRPRIILEKPISPANLVKTICEILKVKSEVVKEAGLELSDERSKLVKLIQETDSDTLRKISAILNKK
ncbi:MAG: response regulator [Pseudomonadota bacterium]|nr:response regulator [Pseudomonadota bacterium]